MSTWYDTGKQIADNDSYEHLTDKIQEREVVVLIVTMSHVYYAGKKSGGNDSC
jgi:hypothetical protein